MRHHGGGGGEHVEQDGMPHVGMLSAGLLLVGFVMLLRAPWKHPKMAVRAITAAVVLLPTYLLFCNDGKAFYSHFWFDIILFVAGAWVSEAEGVAKKEPEPSTWLPD